VEPEHFYYYRDHREETFNLSPGNFMAGRATPADYSARNSGRTPPSDCQFCNDVQLSPWSMGINSEAESREYLLGLCPSCGWWATLQKFTAHYIPGYDSDASFLDYCSSVHQSFAILESFNVAEDEAPLGEIAEVLDEIGVVLLQPVDVRLHECGLLRG